MFRKSLFVVVFILLVVPPVFAQSDTPLSYGDMVEGTITDTPVTYQFEAREGDIINLTVLADDPDQLNLALDVFSPAGELVASNDDYYLLNPALMGQVLAESGTYQIAVRAESGTGRFLIFLEGERSFAPGEVLYEETFDNNDKDWETNSEDETVLFSDLVDGEYVIQYETTESDYYWVVAPGFTNWSAAPIFEPPYQVTVEVSDVESNSESYFLMVIFQAQANYECYDVLSFYPSGYWKYYGCNYQVRDEGIFDNPVDFTDGQTHTLGVQVMEYRLSFFVDDQSHAISTEGLEYLSGSVGFGLGIDFDAHAPQDQLRSAEARFDNVIVRDME